MHIIVLYLKLTVSVYFSPGHSFRNTSPIYHWFGWTMFRKWLRVTKKLSQSPLYPMANACHPSNTHLSTVNLTLSAETWIAIPSGLAVLFVASASRYRFSNVQRVPAPLRINMFTGIELSCNTAGCM